MVFVALADGRSTTAIKTPLEEVRFCAVEVDVHRLLLVVVEQLPCPTIALA